ncbi:hypothetical protein [Mycobacterium shinjukuense]|uniref:hypothetical protein n=1 Tax=Mycobacterium shinjukuense TaxID=398694 RepID=UPI0031019950
MSHEVDPGWPPPAGEPSDDVDTTPPTAESPSGRTLWLLAVLVTLVCIVAIVTFVGNNRRPGANHAPVTTASSPPTSAAPGFHRHRPGPVRTRRSDRDRGGPGQAPARQQDR